MPAPTNSDAETTPSRAVVVSDACSAARVIAFNRTCEICGETFEDVRLASEPPERHPACDECLEFIESEFSWQYDQGRATQGAKKDA